jgi:hypothetical protein
MLQIDDDASLKLRAVNVRLSHDSQFEMGVLLTHIGVDKHCKRMRVNPSNLTKMPGIRNA